MAIRLALVGVLLLVVGGVLNLGGIGPFTVAVGAVALVASGVAWIAARRSGTA
jgi:hypothetical protein